LVLGLIGAFLLAGCGFFSSPNSEIPLHGLLGSSVGTEFSYSFAVAKHEVTQEEFSSLMGFNPVLDGNSQVPQYPVVNVSWFDAVLFCNAKSKKDNLDSVYSYSSIEVDSSGRVDALQGLGVDYSRDGYRLPTEAEWEFVSRKDGNWRFPWGNDSTIASKFAWLQGNSEGHLHEVCALQETLGKYCDLAGNAMEWVGDWYGEYPKEAVVNYVGPSGPNSSSERMVKGASFRHALQELDVRNRHDIYGVYSSTKTEYIGFRVVRGPIEKPTTLGPDGLSEPTQSAVRIVATRADLRSFFGTDAVKMVVVEGGSGELLTLDFSQKNWALMHTTFVATPRLPSISPEGKWLAWGTRSDGQSGVSQGSVAPFSNPHEALSLGTSSVYSPRWVMDEITHKLRIQFAEQGSPNSDSLLWSKGKTYAWQIQDGVLQGAAEALPWAGRFPDGSSTDGRFWLSSFTDLRILDTATGMVSTRFRFPQNGKDSLGSTQVCNASMRPGPNPEVLFLDFGYDKSSSLVGKPYGIHEYLFRMDPHTGVVLGTLAAPTGMRGWDYSEWSNLPGFAVASGVDASETHSAVYAIRIADGATLQLLGGGDLLSPGLWVRQTASGEISLDSVFQYDKLDLVSQGGITYGLKQVLMLQQRDSLELIVLGSSRAYHGVEPSILRQKGLNMAAPSIEAWTMIHQWHHYAKLHLPRLKTVVLELSLDFFPYLSSDIFLPQFAASVGSRYDQNHAYWDAGLPGDVDQILASSDYFPLGDPSQANGYFPLESDSWGENPTGFTEVPGLVGYPPSWKTTMDSLEVMLAELQQAQVQVVGVIFPQHPGFRDVGAWGRYGPSLAQADTVLARILGWESRFGNFRLLDQHRMGLHDYSGLDANDWDHLSAQGAHKLTLRIDSVLALP
jgi:uncharacterized protein (TIGR02171 family)